VVLSHVHYDHHGDPEDFPRSVFVVGPGARGVLRDGLPGSGSHQHFQRDLLPAGRTVEVVRTKSAEAGGGEGEQSVGRWEPLGPFPAAWDVFGDGAVYLLNMPGHLPGHVNLLCRVGPERWVCLAGDTFHDRRLLTGEKEIGMWDDGEGHRLCIHLDPELAVKSIERLRELDKMGNVKIVAAHDVGWWEDNKDKLFPGTM
jgi:glyoxylase-like metal-dependent hydrolase (beta-lactamase superfamily II)